MNWGRYIKRTAVRRIVWIVVGVVVYAAMGIFTDAAAHTGAGHSSRQEAYQHCEAHPLDLSTNPNYQPLQRRCQLNDQGDAYQLQARNHTTGQWAYFGHFFGWADECPGGGTWDDEFKTCNDCVSRPVGQLNVNTSIWGSVPSYCEASCLMATSDPQCTLVEEGPTSGYWCNYVTTPTGALCTGDDKPPAPPDPPPATCESGEVRLPNGQCSPRGQCPVGQHEVDGACHPIGRCPSYHIKAPDGSCTPVPCPSGQARGADGTCKSDDNDDGVPDEDEPGGDGTNTDGKEFSGGESCSVPPTCSGDAIMCGQARIQWRIDCNTRRQRSVEGGNACDNFSMPICVGEDCDPVEHKQLILQWQAMCALKELTSQDGDGEGDGGSAGIDIGSIGEGAADGASGTIGSGGNPGGAFSDGSEGGDGDGQLDTDGLGFGTACPALPSVNVLGVTLDFNTVGPRLCDWMTLGGYIVLILSALLSLRILAGGMAV